jgi:hypothetical protein
MSTIQQLKNFIRHGKQARAVDESARAKPDNSSPKQQQTAAKNTMATRSSEPTLGTSSAAAHHDPVQPQAVDIKAKQNKRIPDENIAKLVAEENESKSKFPHYPGLERWTLVEKMGDGAFSNVYRARDREGDAGEVAIKVVRKFEMNSMQSNKHLHPDFKPKAPKAAEVRGISFPLSHSSACLSTTASVIALAVGGLLLPPSQAPGFAFRFCVV